MMEHLNPATHSHVVEKAPKVMLGEAAQWIFERGIPVVTHGCARTNGGEGKYIHKEKVGCALGSWN